MSPSTPALRLSAPSPPAPRTLSLHAASPTHASSSPSPPPPAPPAALPRPLIYRAKFGASSPWSLDVFSLPHNAVRAECRDLYNILQSIHARSPRVCPAELDEFAAWWRVFDAFLLEYFDFEADVLFPAVFVPARPALPKDPDRALHRHLVERKEPLLDALRQIDGSFDLRRNLDPSDAFHNILREVNAFVPSLMHYFHLQERHLPHRVSRIYSPSFKDLIATKYLAYIRRGDAPHLHLPLLVRWIDPPTRQKWLRAHAPTLTRLFFTRWHRKCRRAHLSIPFRFHQRLACSVRHVAASRLRRRSEFAEDDDDLSLTSLPSMDLSFKSLSALTRAKDPPPARSAGRSTGAERTRGNKTRRLWR